MKVSVCIPVYNIPPDFLKKTLDSILAQTYSNFEIIVNDDNSTIDYSQLISSYKKIKKIKFYRNKKNLGMANNWNEAVRKSCGDLVIIFGHDDIMESTMLETFVKEFEGNRNVSLCACRRIFIDENDNILNIKRFVNSPDKIFIRENKYILDTRQVFKLCLRNGNVLGGPSCVMFKRKDFDKVRGFDPKFPHKADLDMWLKLALLGNIVFINKPLVKRRIHKGRLTTTNILLGKVSEDRVRIHEKYKKAMFFSEEEISWFKARIALTSILDILRGLRYKKINLIKIGLKNFYRFFEFKPKIYYSYLKEFILGENIDAM